MKVLRYTDSIQKQLGSKTKPEPWLHVAVIEGIRNAVDYAIYVWDTRKVVELGNASVTYNKIEGNSAVDNNQLLDGIQPTESFNFDFCLRQMKPEMRDDFWFLYKAKHSPYRDMSSGSVIAVSNRFYEDLRYTVNQYRRTKNPLMKSVVEGVKRRLNELQK